MSDSRISKYQSILCKEFPEEFFDRYINTREMQNLKGKGQFCGADYCGLSGYNNLKFFYSKLDHSISAARIVYNFTGSKQAALATLFHDIKTPIFSHAIDYMNGDAILQVSTESGTEEAIRNSMEIRRLLLEDGISIDDVVDYKKYSIADNERPKLSADRLEGLLSACYIWLNIWDLSDIEYIYNNINICINEDSEVELCIQNRRVSRKLVNGMIALLDALQSKEDKYSLTFLGSIVKEAIWSKLVTYEDLSAIAEEDMIKKIEGSDTSWLQYMWKYFQKNEYVDNPNRDIEKMYDIQIKCKKAIINPLVYSGIKGYRRAIKPRKMKRLLESENDEYDFAYVKL